MKTWQKESLVIAAILIVTGTLSVIGGFPIIEAIISGSAVWLTFSHAQVSDRLAAYARKGSKPVECVRFERLYYIGKELMWLALFVWQWNLPALVGTIAFILYPIWRSYHAQSN